MVTKKKESEKSEQVLQNGESLNDDQLIEATPVAKTQTGKKVFVNPGECLVVEKETGVPFVVSKRLWETIYSKQPEKFELKKT